MSNKITYISIDIECTGPIPGPFSMISLGAVAYTAHGKLLDSLTFNIKELPNSARDPNTMKFWSSYKAAWELCQVNQLDPQLAMNKFIAWLNKFENIVPICYPAGFDFTFIYWYIVNYCGVNKNPLSFSCLDIKTYIAAILNVPYYSVSKAMLPKEWLPERRHSHIALDDALEQGYIFFKMLEYCNKLESGNLIAGKQ